MQEIARQLRRKDKSIGLVPTMGALHPGHLSLIRRARQENDCAVVSIFVNPLQFGPREDLKQYPRNLKQDAQLCQRAGAGILFYPDNKAMYPAGYKTYISVESLGDCLCGKSRPGHFQGVATVVAKLFNIVSPDVAYFGQKDAQQAMIINRIASDLNLPLKIKVLPTLREKDGLAMSSRNAYLSSRERKDAVVLSQALVKAKEMLRSGRKNVKEISAAMRKIINAKKTAKIDYIAIVDPINLKPLKQIKSKALIALAVWIGKTRLIDNYYA